MIDDTKLVFIFAMNIYAKALTAYLESPDAPNQSDLAEKVKSTQASISRYATGERFPNVEMARLIQAATGGAVALETWRQVAAERAGLAA